MRHENHRDPWPGLLCSGPRWFRLRWSLLGLACVGLAFGSSGCSDDTSKPDPADSTPPEPVSDLVAVVAGAGDTIRIAWTAPADDGSEAVTAYDLRFLDLEITEPLWDVAHEIEGLPVPRAPGSDEGHAVELAFGMRYFALRSMDEVGNVASLSNVAALADGDTIPPGSILDLSAALAGETDIDLTWTAPGDDGEEGSAVEYDIRLAVGGPPDGGWDDATPIPGPPAPGVAGTGQSVRLERVQDGRRYAFALRSRDEMQWSSWSNVAEIETPDHLPPEAVSTLSDLYVGGHSVTISWTASGDAGHGGRAFRNDLRFSDSPITEQTFDYATPVPDVPAPLDAGETETVIVPELDLESTYYFALRVEDDAGNVSGLSNVVVATTVRKQQLTFGGGDGVSATAPSWSPDGRFIAFSANFDDASSDIYVIPSTGGIPTRLTEDPTGSTDPSWGPNGEELAFISARGGRQEVWVMSLTEDTAPRRIVGHDDDIPRCAWSPDGTLIAYSAYVSRDPPETAIYLVSADGSADPVQLAYLRWNRFMDPAWSAESEFLAFTRNQTGLSGILTVPRSGGSPRLLTRSPEPSTSPSWSPDGSRISFSVAQDGIPTLWTMDPTGSDQVQIGDGTLPELYSAWSPDGRAIAVSVGDDLDIWVYYLE